MAVQYFYKGKEILHVKSSTFETLYENILNIIDDKNLKLSQNLQLLIDKLYTGCYGFGFDIAKYVTKKHDMNLFLELVKEGIEKFEKKFPDLSEESKKRLGNFHNELLKYAEELE